MPSPGPGDALLASRHPASIGAHDRVRYHEQGFAVLERRLDEVTRSRLLDAVTTWATRADPPSPYGILKHNLWREQETVAQLLGDGWLAALAGGLLEVPEVVLFQDNLVWKPPGAGRIEWHQDYSYWPLDRPAGVTLWIALDDADAANGCLHYLPGTHRLGERQAADFIAGAGQPRRGTLPPLDWAAREHDAVAAVAAAGQILAHHPLVWHMSPPNVSVGPRRALTLTWITPAVRWAPDHAPHPYTHALVPTPGEPVRGELFPRFAEDRGRGLERGP